VNEYLNWVHTFFLICFTVYTEKQKKRLDLSDILDMYVGHPGVCWIYMHSFRDFMCIMDMYRRI
jgi:hypothetical protein